MNDGYLEALEKYEGETLEIRRGRGAWICKRSDGLKVLKEYRGTLKRLEFEEAVLSVLEKEKGFWVDQYIRNKEGELLSAAGDGTKYVLKNWFPDRECNLKDSGEVLLAVSQMGRMHRDLRDIQWKEEWNLGSVVSPGLDEEMERHNREMKRVRTYVSKKRKKSEFDLTVMHSFDFFYDQALKAQKGLELLRTKKGLNRLFLCHGDMDQHHVLIRPGSVAFIEFNQMYQGIQISDLYRFMRKVMEKHNWDVGLGLAMMEHYGKALPLEENDRTCLYYLFLYPEKYWKQLNYYNNANKAWIPGKNVEKLKNLEEQQEGRNRFLSKIK